MWSKSYIFIYRCRFLHCVHKTTVILDLLWIFSLHCLSLCTQQMINSRREHEVTEIKGHNEGLVQRVFLELPIRSDLQLIRSSWQQCLTLILVPPMRKCLKAYKRYRRCHTAGLTSRAALRWTALSFIGHL